MEGRYLSVIALKFYIYHECLQSHLGIMDGNDAVELMVPEVVGDVKMSRAANKIFPIFNVGIGCTNGRTENGKYYLLGFCII